MLTFPFPFPFPRWRSRFYVFLSVLMALLVVFSFCTLGTFLFADFPTSLTIPWRQSSFFFLVFFWLLFVVGSFATFFFLTGLFFDPLFRTVIHWTLKRLSVYPLLSPGLVLKIYLCIIRGFLWFFFTCLGAAPFGAAAGTVLFYFFIP